MTEVSNELQRVRAEADRLGISYHHKNNAATIQKSIDDFNGSDTEVTKENPQNRFLKEEIVPKTEAQMRDEDFQERKRLSNSLIRCRIQNRHPDKKDWPGEMLSVGSAKLGTFKKYIPYGTDEPYHVPKILFDMMKEKKCKQYYTAIGTKGNKTKKSRLINEFALEVLDPLTPEELKELARRQAMREGREG